MPSRSFAPLLRRVPPGLWRAAVRRRLLLAAAAAAASVACALTALAPPAPVTAAVLVAADDLGAGRVLTAEDLRIQRLPRDAVPRGALSDPGRLVGQVLAGPARGGEPLTDVRILGPDLLAGYGASMVATAVRVADAGTLALVRPGDVVDLHASSLSAAGTATARTVATGVRVITVPGEGSAATGEGALLIVGATSGTAERLSAAADVARISAVLRAR